MSNTHKKIVAGLSSLLLLMGTWSVAAQSINVTGNVTGETGEPVAGAMVAVEGTQSVSITDGNGHYSISVPSQNSVLTFSFMGYMTVSRTVGTSRVIDVILATDATQIDEVVVTALGIERKEKSLTYSTQIVSGDELTRVQDPNFMNSLAGKTSGVQINRSSAGIGGSAKVVIRGNRSINGVGGPLYVIDGVPIGGTGNGGTTTYDSFGPWEGGMDTGDAISNLNPDDIQSMNILKGPSAAALYGTSAANGVIMITTKKGVAGRIDVSFNSNTTFDSAVYGRPEFQNHYGGTNTSWGDPVNKSVDYLKDYFQTGATTINSLSLSSGNERMQTYFSYANTYSKGVVPGNELNKHNLNFRETASFFNDRLKVDANINMMYQRMENLISPGGYYMNPLVGLYRFPRGGGIQGGESFEYYRDQYSIHDDARNLDVQNWFKALDPTNDQNPFWLINRTPSDSRRYRTLANLSLSYKFSDLFTLQVRGKADYTQNWFDKKLYAGTTPGLVSSGNGANGFYSTNQSYDLSLYADILLTYQQSWENWSVSATAGASVADVHGRSQGISSVSTGLKFANIFDVDNIIAPARPAANKWRGPQDQAVFFAGQVGWKDQVFVDVTARNDWTSTLAYTKSMKKGFFYPSVGVSWLFNETFSLPEWIDLAKVRATWARVGNGLPGGSTNPKNTIVYGPSIDWNETAPFGELKPEMTTSVEYGTEWRFFGSRLEFDFTYYLTHSRNQAFNVSAGSGSEFESRWINAGDIRNAGVEISLAGTPVLTPSFRWRTGFNFSHNKNKIVRLLGGVVDNFEFLQVGSDNVNNGFQMRAYEGGSFGDIYGYAFERGEKIIDENGKETDEYTHEGAIVWDEETGLPMRAPTNYLRKIGNASPKFNLSWNNTINWKGVNLYFLIDGRFGGDVVSMTEADMDLFGTSKRTGDARDRGFIDFDGRRIEGDEKIQAFFREVVGGRGGVTEHYVYDATNIRMREISLGYTLPAKWFANTGWIKGIDLSLVGRNLFFIYKKAPYDPDALMSTGLDLQGVDVYGLPSMRSFGFNVKLNF